MILKAILVKVAFFCVGGLKMRLFYPKLNEKSMK